MNIFYNIIKKFKNNIVIDKKNIYKYIDDIK